MTGTELKVINIIAELLYMYPDECKLDTKLVDIGAEAIDFYDIVFRLEKKFDVGLKHTGLHWKKDDTTVRDFTEAVDKALGPRAGVNQELWNV